MKNNHLRLWFIAAFFALLSLVLTFIIFHGLSRLKFIYIGDQFFRFSLHETYINSFFIRKPENLSVLNAWQLSTQFWDILYYLFVYSLNVSFYYAERLLFFLCLFLSFSFTFIGLSKLSKLYEIKVSSAILVIISIWYCINPYTVILWHGGIYNLGVTFTYALCPLLLYFFHLSLFDKFNFKNILICSILLFVSSFTFWLFAPVVFFLLLYLIFYFLLFKPAWNRIIKSGIFIALLYLLLSSPIVFTILYEMLNNKGDVNSLYIPTFGSQKGGMRFQLYMWFSWGIYTVWTPRSLFSFGEYYFSNLYLIPTKLLYFTVISGFMGMLMKIKGKNIDFVKYCKKIWKFHDFRLFLLFVVIFSISLFMAKGPQEPFGGVFLYLYQHVPLFSVFRTADIRFGFCIILCLAIMLCLLQKYFNRYLFLLIMLVVVILPNWPFFNGVAVKGEEIKGKYYDRVLYMPHDYEEIASMINSDSTTLGYVLPLPSLSYGHFLLDNSKNHVGQDMLSKLIKTPFLYLSQSDGTYKNTYDVLYNVLKNREISSLQHFPIQYILFRRDVSCEACVTISEKDLGQDFEKVFSNNTFTLFNNKKFLPLIRANNSSIKQISPTHLKVEINKLDQDNLKLLYSYNPDWKIFIAKKNAFGSCDRSRSFENMKACVNDLSSKILQFITPSFSNNSHKIVYGYANQWTLDKKEIIKKYGEDYYSVNRDGSINIVVDVVFFPQIYLRLFSIMSMLSLVIITIFLVSYHRNDKKTKQT